MTFHQEPSSIDLLSRYALSSSKHIAAIEPAVNKARSIAKKAKRENILYADLGEAIFANIIPSDKGLALALAEPARAGRSRAIAARPQGPGEPSAAPAPATRNGRAALQLGESHGADRGIKPVAVTEP